MRLTHYIAIASALLLASCSSKVPTTAEDMCLQGKVKTLEEFQYRAAEKFGEIAQGDPYREEGEWDLRFIFDEKGYCKKVHQLTPEGEDVGTVTYSYNKEGRKILERNFDADGNFTDELSFHYDKQGRIVKMQKYLTDSNPAGSVVYEYGDRTKSVKHYNFKGELLQREEQTLSKHNFPLETKIYGKEGDLVSWRKEKYNVDGLREELIGYEDDGAVAFEVMYTYDKYGNMLSQVGDDVVPQTIEYTYDNRGNWVKAVMKEDGQPQLLTIRNFTYWDEKQ